MIGMGFTNDWHALAACRVILGLFEAGFFPVSASIYRNGTHHVQYSLC